ncbi:MAG: DUF2383 domain-containing protein [Oligoflexia bacterium]|nr:DUF2383 domain-containing protein [Oligoflexia bacterium]
MVTFVGTQKEFSDALKSLIELDYDAIEAYEEAIHRVDGQTYKEVLKEFTQDHKRHVHELSNLLLSKGVEVPKGPSIKQLLTKGKVVIATLISDKLILTAMRSNEDDTNTAYERMNSRTDIWPEAQSLILSGLADERKHKSWINEQLQRL